VVEVGHIQTSNITQDSLAGVQEDREQFNRQIAPTTTLQDQTSNNTLNKQIQEKPVQAECTGPQSTEMDREDNKRCWKQQTEKKYRSNSPSLESTTKTITRDEYVDMEVTYEQSPCIPDVTGQSKRASWADDGLNNDLPQPAEGHNEDTDRGEERITPLISTDEDYPEDQIS
jgi:hypothetical protein